MRRHNLLAMCCLAAVAQMSLGQTCTSIEPAPFAVVNGADGRATSNMEPVIYAAVVHDFDGDGPQPERLIVSGSFIQMGGALANGVAAFDGQRWHPLGRGLVLEGFASHIHGGACLLIHNNELYVGGKFASAHDSIRAIDTVSNPLVKWNGMTWESVFERPSTSRIFGEVWDLNSLGGQVYIAGTFGAPNPIGVLRADRIEYIPVPGISGSAYGLVRVGDELWFGSGESSYAWNGTTYRLLPRPSNRSEYFPAAGLQTPSGLVLGGDTGVLVPPGLYTSTLFDGTTHTPLTGLQSSRVGSRFRTVWRFTSDNGTIRAWAPAPLPNGNPYVRRLENGVWVDDPLPRFETEQYVYFRGDVRFQNRRYLYGDVIAEYSRLAGFSSDPYRNLFGATDQNTLHPLDGVYPITFGRTGAPNDANRALTRLGSDIVLGGPLQFVSENQSINFVAKWDGERWKRVAENDLLDAPAALATLGGVLYAIAPLTSANTMELLRVENKRWIPVPGPAIPFSYQSRLDIVNNEVWLILPTATGDTSRLYRVTPTGLTALPTNGLPASLSTSRVIGTGNGLFLHSQTSLFKFADTEWTPIPGVGPVAANSIFMNGALHFVSGGSASVPIRVYRLDGSSWTLVSTAPVGFAVSGVSELDGVLHVVGAQPGIALASFNLTDGTWTTVNWPDALGSGNAFPEIAQYASGSGVNREVRVMRDAAGRTLIIGPFTSVGLTRTQGIAVVQQARINIHWPPLPRSTTRNSTVSIGVGATGPKNHDGDLTYQWLRNDQPLTNGVTPNGSTISGATTRRLQLSLAQLADAGMYSVRITLPCGVTTTTTPVPITVSICNDIDFNNNGLWPENQDADDFINVFAGASCPACDDVDFNNNGVFPEDEDIIDFFTVFAGGNC